MKIEDLLEKQQPGTYAGVKFSGETKDMLSSYMKDNNIPNSLSPDKLHCTLLYSKKPCPDYKPQGKIDPPYRGTPGKFHIWESQPDDDGKKSNCLVMEFECLELTKRHEYLMKEHNATYDYDDYKSHITMSYDVGDLKINKLPKLKKSLEMTKEYYEPLKVEWAKTNTEK